jgi:hypothetical protein
MEAKNFIDDFKNNKLEYRSQVDKKYHAINFPLPKLKQVRINTVEMEIGEESFTFDMEYYKPIYSTDFNKTNNAIKANIIHTIDAQCLRVMMKYFKYKGAESSIIPIHDEVIVCISNLELAFESYNLTLGGSNIRPFI